MIRHPVISAQEHRTLLGEIHLFRELSDDMFEALRHASHYLEVEKGTFLFHRGDPANGFYYLIGGCVKIVLISPRGDEKVIEIMRDGMTFGEAVMFIERPFPAAAQITEASRLLFIEREPVVELLREEPDFALRMLSGLSMRLHSLVQDVESYSLHSAVQRVIGYLLRELDYGDTDVVQRSEVVELPTAKFLIASRLNITPETFSRVLNQLSHKGLISVQGAHITIHDAEALSCHGQ